jgi:hypothetical protein
MMSLKGGAMKSQTLLIDAIQQTLVPALSMRGFNQIPSDQKDLLSQELKTAFPFGRMHRPGSITTDLMEIQMDQNGKGAFRLNFGRVPNAGIDHETGHISLENVWVQYLDQYFQLYQSRFWRRWFSIKASDSSQELRAASSELVAMVVGLISEVEESLKSGKSSPHVKRVRK